MYDFPFSFQCVLSHIACLVLASHVWCCVRGVSLAPGLCLFRQHCMTGLARTWRLPFIHTMQRPEYNKCSSHYQFLPFSKTWEMLRRRTDISPVYIYVHVRQFIKSSLLLMVWPSVIQCYHIEWYCTSCWISYLRIGRPAVSRQLLGSTEARLRAEILLFMDSAMSLAPVTVSRHSPATE